MGNIILKLKHMMAGRNGIDKLTYGLLAVYCVIAAVKVFFKWNLHVWVAISILQYLFLGYILFRVFSKNVQKRYKENFKFEQFLAAWKPYFEHLKLRITFFKSHRFRTCTSCGEFLRLKKGRGVRNIRCPKCGASLRFHFLF